MWMHLWRLFWVLGLLVVRQAFWVNSVSWVQRLLHTSTYMNVDTAVSLYALVALRSYISEEWDHFTFKLAEIN